MADEVYSCILRMSSGRELVVAVGVDPGTFHFWIDQVFGSVEREGREVPAEITFALDSDADPHLQEPLAPCACGHPRGWHHTPMYGGQGYACYQDCDCKGFVPAPPWDEYGDYEDEQAEDEEMEG